MTLSVRIALAAGFTLIAASAFASTTNGIADVPAADDAGLLKVAQGMTPEGWRVEGPPRYKRATTPSQSRMSEPTYFREEGPPRYKKSKKSGSATTGSGR